ncbi:hypothetical protein ILYODFUR_027513 [Ilyodon furcidens]|uniref:Uncharacterized protein n=1 Tax=Ilyodon furcidens TaxID=33524 RepID=A0ABV0SPQ8_9TELE
MLPKKVTAGERKISIKRFGFLFPSILSWVLTQILNKREAFLLLYFCLIQRHTGLCLWDKLIRVLLIEQQPAIPHWRTPLPAGLHPCFVSGTTLHYISAA